MSSGAVHVPFTGIRIPHRYTGIPVVRTIMIAALQYLLAAGRTVSWWTKEHTVSIMGLIIANSIFHLLNLIKKVSDRYQ